MSKEERLALLLEVFEDTPVNFSQGKYTPDFHIETVRHLLADVRQLIAEDADAEADDTRVLN